MIMESQESRGAVLDLPATLEAAAAAGILQSGDDIHCKTDAWFPRRIERALGSWGSHDAMVVRNTQGMCVGESIHPRACYSPFSKYDRGIASGRIQIVVLRPKGATPLQGSIAAAWWMQNILGKPYDWGSFPRLLVKSLIGDRCAWPVGWEWAWYCTEGVRDAWRNGAGFDPWDKRQPTPFTTEKRCRSGAFEVVWQSRNATFQSSPDPVDAEASTVNAKQLRAFPYTTARFTVA